MLQIFHHPRAMNRGREEAASTGRSASTPPRETRGGDPGAGATRAMRDSDTSRAAPPGLTSLFLLTQGLRPGLPSRRASDGHTPGLKPWASTRHSRGRLHPNKPKPGLPGTPGLWSMLFHHPSAINRGREEGQGTHALDTFRQNTRSLRPTRTLMSTRARFTSVGMTISGMEAIWTSHAGAKARSCTGVYGTA